MKKITYFILAGAFVTVLSSCGSSGDQQNDENQDTVQTMPPEAEQQVPAEDEQQPANEEGKNELVKPDHYPDAGVADIGDSFSEENMLDNESISKILDAWRGIIALGDKITAEIKMPDDSAKAILASVVAEHGFESWDNYQAHLTAMVTSMMALPTLIELEKAKGNNDIAYDMSRQIAISAVAQGHISKDDLKLVYDNWDEAKAVVDEINKANPQQ